MIDFKLQHLHCSTHAPMRDLLSLPRELRDQIIEHVILSRKKPPPDPAHDEQLRQDATGQGALRLPSASPPTYNASGLLGASTQLRYETQSLLSHLKLSFSLDVMIVDDELWPTWTCCPSRAPSRIEFINVSLRFFSRPNDPFMVHVARTFWAILQGRKWTKRPLHPLAELFLHIRDVCLQLGPKGNSIIETLCFDAFTTDHLREVSSMNPVEPMSTPGLKSLFGKHRSLWNSFRSIHQYPFAGNGGVGRLDPVTSLKIMVILILQDSWEDECADYTTYVGPLGAAFRSLRNIRFAVNGQDLGQLTTGVLST